MSVVNFNSNSSLPLIEPEVIPGLPNEVSNRILLFVIRNALTSFNPADRQIVCQLACVSKTWKIWSESCWSSLWIDCPLFPIKSVSNLFQQIVIHPNLINNYSLKPEDWPSLPSYQQAKLLSTILTSCWDPNYRPDSEGKRSFRRLVEVTRELLLHKEIFDSTERKTNFIKDFKSLFEAIKNRLKAEAFYFYESALNKLEEEGSTLYIYLMGRMFDRQVSHSFDLDPNQTIPPHLQTHCQDSPESMLLIMTRFAQDRYQLLNNCNPIQSFNDHWSQLPEFLATRVIQRSLAASSIDFEDPFIQGDQFFELKKRRIKELKAYFREHLGVPLPLSLISFSIASNKPRLAEAIIQELFYNSDVDKEQAFGILRSYFKNLLADPNLPSTHSLAALFQILLKLSCVHQLIDSTFEAPSLLSIVMSTPYKQSLEWAERILEERANVNACNEDGETALHLACHIPDHWNFLVGKTANMHLADVEGNTPLMLYLHGKELKEWIEVLESGGHFRTVTNRADLATSLYTLCFQTLSSDASEEAIHLLKNILLKVLEENPETLSETVKPLIVIYNILFPSNQQVRQIWEDLMETNTALVVEMSLINTILGQFITEEHVEIIKNLISRDASIQTWVDLARFLYVDQTLSKVSSPILNEIFIEGYRGSNGIDLIEVESLIHLMVDLPDSKQFILFESAIKEEIESGEKRSKPFSLIIAKSLTTPFPLEKWEYLKKLGLRFPCEKFLSKLNPKAVDKHIVHYVLSQSNASELNISKLKQTLALWKVLLEEPTKAKVSPRKRGRFKSRLSEAVEILQNYCEKDRSPKRQLPTSSSESPNTNKYRRIGPNRVLFEEKGTLKRSNSSLTSSSSSIELTGSHDELV